MGRTSAETPAETPTETAIAARTARNALFVYLAVWVLGLGFPLDGAWFLASLTGLVYVGLHHREHRRWNRTFMEADRLALPLSFLTFSATVVALGLSGHSPLEGKSIALCWAMYLVVFVVGHAAALSFAAAARAVARFRLRSRSTGSDR